MYYKNWLANKSINLIQLYPLTPMQNNINQPLINSPYTQNEPYAHNPPYTQNDPNPYSPQQYALPP